MTLDKIVKNAFINALNAAAGVYVMNVNKKKIIRFKEYFLLAGVHGVLKTKMDHASSLLVLKDSFLLINMGI